MNEEETRAEYIDPKLKASGWGETEGSKVRREYYFTLGRIQTGGNRVKPEKADYLLIYKNQNLAVIEAKKLDLSKTEGLTQAKDYAERLQTPFTYSTNGKEIYEGDLIKHDLWGITEIVWEHGMFRGSNYENSKNKKWNELIDVTLADHQLQRCRIIGNVFENKNLLVPPKTQRYEKTNREREDGL